MSTLESPEACALQLRRLLLLDSEISGRDASELAEHLLMELTAYVAPESGEERMTRKLSADLKDFFLGPHASGDGVALRIRNDLTRRVELLHQGVIQSRRQRAHLKRSS